MQGQAEQLSKIKKKCLATTYKPLFPPLYSLTDLTVGLNILLVDNEGSKRPHYVQR